MNKQGGEAEKSRLWAFSPRTAKNYVKLVMNEAGVTGLRATSRGLRHSMGVMLALDKAPIHIIQQVLGHRSVNNT